MVMAFYVDAHAAIVFAVAIPILSLVVFSMGHNKIRQLYKLYKNLGHIAD